jgi:hypothetical protein
VPKGATPGPIVVKTGFGQASSTATFVAHPDGYRFVDGFPFVNTVEDDDATDGFPDNFSWETFEQTFGVCSMWMCALGVGTLPDPISTLLFLGLNDQLDSGCCHGFALTSLQLKKGIIPSSPYPVTGAGPPLAETLFDSAEPNRPSPALSQTIQSRQLVTFSDEALGFYLNKWDVVPGVNGNFCVMDARPELAEMQAALGSGLADPPMLAFAKNCSPFDGHVVVPYAVETAGSAKRIRAYDPNLPGTPAALADSAKSVFTVNPATGVWSYPFSDGTTWGGTFMFNIPLSAYGHQETWSLPGLGALFGLINITLGSAVTAGGGAITQAADGAGRQLFAADGTVTRDHARWPANVRPMPGMSRRAGAPPMVVLTGTAPVHFTITPTTARSQVAIEPVQFAIARGGGFSVEQIQDEMRVEFRPEQKLLRVAPVAGTSSAIVRLTHRFREESESLAYAFRVAGLAAGEPFEVAPAEDGRVAVVSASTAARTVDLEVTHTSRIGQQRVFQSDQITIPANTTARVTVPDPEQLDVAGLSPVVLRLQGPGAASDLAVARNVVGPVVEAPHRVVVTVRRPIPIGSATPKPAPTEHDVAIPLKRHGASPEAVSIRALYHGGPQPKTTATGLTLSLPHGTRPVQLVAEDAQGRRSFPRTVFVTVARTGEPTRSPLTAFGADVDVAPGKSMRIPIGLYTVDEAVRGMTLELSARRRRSGTGRSRPTFPNNGLRLSRDVATSGSTVSASPGLDPVATTVKALWPASQARSGKFEVGTLALNIPADVPLGSTFIIEGTGTAVLAEGDGTRTVDLAIVPILVRVWGGPEPAKLDIDAPSTVVEDAAIELAARAEGVPAVDAKVGWWVQSVTGRAAIVPDRRNPLRAALRGERAGWVVVHVVVGTKTTSHRVHVVPPGASDARVAPRSRGAVFIGTPSVAARNGGGAVNGRG